MRKAYGGRAAAYEKKGDYELALADYKMAVLYFALEAEILTGLDSPDRGKFLAETAGAYRARSNCLEAMKRLDEAAIDRKRADGLDADAKKLENKIAPAKEGVAQTLQVQNAWSQHVTLVIAGVTYRLEAGEQKTITITSATIPFEMQAGTYRTTGTLEAGKTYTIRPTP